MNKKFLKTILFGALLVASTGTFVSCKDYDDDIDRIDKELADIKSQIAALQAKVDAGKYVTNVTKSGDGIVITWNDGSSSTIETIKGDKGDEVEIHIDPTSKNWIIDGEDTGICAEGKNGEPGQPGQNGEPGKSPQINTETGNWEVWNVETEQYEDTGISAKGASAYVIDNGDHYILHIAADEAGSRFEEIRLPKTSTVFSSLEVMGYYDDNNGELIPWSDNNGNVEYNFARVTATGTANFHQWNTLAEATPLADGQVLSTLNNGKVLIHVTPTNADISERRFSIVNSQGASCVSLTNLEQFNGLLQTRSTTDGLWLATLAPTGATTSYPNDNAYMTQFENGAKKVAYALYDGELNYTSSFNIKFQRNAAAIPLNATLQNINGQAPVVAPAAPGASGTRVNIGEEVGLTFDRPNLVYDYVIDIAEADIIRWGINLASDKRSFTVGRLADQVTLTTFEIKVSYVDLGGNIHYKDRYLIQPNKIYSGQTTLTEQTITISPTAAENVINFRLDKMYEDLRNTSADAETLWRADVDLATTTVQVYEGTTPPTVKPVLTGNVSGDYQQLTVDVDDARTTAYNLNSSYYAEITFKDANGETLNTVKAPFKLGIPALQGLFRKEHAVFGGTNTGNAYMNLEDQATPYAADGKSRYAFKHAFKNFNNIWTNTAVTFGISTTQMVDSQRADAIANIINANNADAAIELTDNDAAYGKAIDIVIVNAQYLNIYTYSQAECEGSAFQLKVLSPIKEGNISANNADNVIEIVATGAKVQLRDDKFRAVTYANQSYSIFTTTAQNPTSYIQATAFASANTNLFEVAPAPLYDADGKGYAEVTPKNVAYADDDDLNVTVTDIWGYVKRVSVNVKVKPNGN